MMPPADNREGFTLVEVMVAMLVLAMTMVALTQTTRTFSMSAEAATAALTAAGEARRIETLLRRRLGAGPFSAASDRSEALLEGSSNQMTYECGRPSLCLLTLVGGDTPALAGSDGERLALRRGAVQFRYLTEAGAAAAYPAGEVSESLVGVAVVSADGKVRGLLRFSVQQSADCAFDETNHRCYPDSGRRL